MSRKPDQWWNESDEVNGSEVCGGLRALEEACCAFTHVRVIPAASSVVKRDTTLLFLCRDE